MPQRTLYIIDAHAQIFRAYYAIRGGMTSPVTAEPTHAIFGFAGMLLKLLEQFRPHYVILATDMPGRTFRDDIYAEYKATRDAAPDDYRPQVERIMQMTKMFGIPIIGQDGAEADDVIATCVQRLLDDPTYSDVHVRIVSKDKDLEQLLGPRVTMFDIHKDELIDTNALMTNKGIKPEQVIDMLTLMGDTVDNIPGIDGIGPKTAVQLIQEYGTIEGIYANIEKIKGKRKENLIKGQPFIAIARQLVTLKRDLVLDFDLNKAEVGAIDATGLRGFFKEMGFRRYQTDIDNLLAAGDKARSATQAAAAAAPAAKSDGDFAMSLFDEAPSMPTPGSAAGVHSSSTGETAGLTHASDFEYRAITTREQMDDLVATLRRQKMISVDTETIGLGHRTQMCGICLAWETGNGVYIPVASPHPESHLDRAAVLDALRPVLEDAAIPKCGHNLKYDLLVLREAGITMRGVTFDSMIASFLLGMPAHGLDPLAMTLLKHEMIPISALIGPSHTEAGRKQSQRTMDQVPLDQITQYAAEDADMALRLYEVLRPQLVENGLDGLANDIEMPLVEVLAEMEHAGIRVDPDELDRQKERLSSRIVELRTEILNRARVDFNIDSPKQLADVLFTQLGLPVIKRTKTGPSTDIEVLEKLAELEGLPADKAAIPALIVEYRQLTKLVGTYLGNLKDAIQPVTKRVHATFHQTGAATGRLSSSGPNLQNIPIRTEVGRLIRKAFVAEEGHQLISADYSQIELRVLAHLSEDPALIEAFERDMDIHTAVAAQVFGVPPDDVSKEQRAQAKVINFGIIYGVTPYGLSRRIEGLDVKAAGALIDSYRKRFAGIDTFMHECVAMAEKQGYVTTMTGRRREIGQVTSRNPQQRALGERLAINTVVQGSAADLIKLAMVNLHRRIASERLPMRILLQIHDELVCEAPTAEAAGQAKIVCAAMEGAMKLKVPLKVEAGVGGDWFGAK